MGKGGLSGAEKPDDSDENDDIAPKVDGAGEGNGMNPEEEAGRLYRGPACPCRDGVGGGWLTVGPLS
jgi:hypothetical protein